MIFTLEILVLHDLIVDEVKTKVAFVLDDRFVLSEGC